MSRSYLVATIAPPMNTKALPPSRPCHRRNRPQPEGLHPADRLDPEPVPVGIDEGDHLVGRRSSSAPKKAAADFRISLARRSSRFSRSSVFSRSPSSLVSPTREPSSTSARRTQLRSVSCEMPNLAAIEQIAAHCEGCSPWCSNTMRTARSRNSRGYLPCLVMAPTSHESKPPGIPVRFISGDAKCGPGLPGPHPTAPYNLEGESALPPRRRSALPSAAGTPW